MPSPKTHSRDSHPELPVDPDIVRAQKSKQHVYLSATFQIVVFIGGCFGTLARYTATLAIPDKTGSLPIATLFVNLTGAFALGCLLESLAARGNDTGKRRLIRLGIGTGFIGAFTTYSTLAVEAVLLAQNGDTILAAEYAVFSICGGAIASALGIQIASKRYRLRSKRA